jgi:hypothetical protein
LGTKYSATAVSGYNATPPSDDGTQSASNQVFWSTIKTKLGDPVNTFAAAIDGKLQTTLDTSVRQISASDSTVATDHWKTIEIAAAVSVGLTVSLGDAASMASGYIVTVDNLSAISHTIGRVTSANGINGVVGNVTLPSKMSMTFKVNSAQGGYNIEAGGNSFGTGIGVGGTAAGTGGIAFPAAAVAVADVNTLDDYEEGSWTPSVGGSATYTTQVGKYTKIGDTVFIQMFLTINAIGTGSTTTVSGLPFTSNGNFNNAFTVSQSSSLATSLIYVVGNTGGTATTIVFGGNAAAGTAVPAAQAIFGNGTHVSCAGFYHI